MTTKLNQLRKMTAGREIELHMPNTTPKEAKWKRQYAVYVRGDSRDQWSTCVVCGYGSTLRTAIVATIKNWKKKRTQ